jgi:bacteriorhodopsin
MSFSFIIASNWWFSATAAAAVFGGATSVLGRKNKIINRTAQKTPQNKNMQWYPYNWYGIKTVFHLHATVMCYTQVDFTVAPKNRKVQTWNTWRLFPVTLWDLYHESGSNTVLQQSNSSLPIFPLWMLQSSSTTLLLLHRAHQLMQQNLS